MGLGARISFAFRAFFALLVGGRVPDDILDRFRPVMTVPPAPTAAVRTPREDTGEGAVQVLSLLQRDGRLVDFLQEDIDAYDDAQIGAAVRDVHANCRAVLQRYFTLEPVLIEAEGAPLRVTTADPTHVKLVGAVTSSLPQQGVVRHRGWRVTALALPPLAAQGTGRIIAPAEVEVG